MHRLPIAAALALLVALPALAEEYTLTPDSGETIEAAIARLQPGDTLSLSGTFREENIEIAVAGTADAPITIRSAPGERAVIDTRYPEFLEAGNDAWEVVDAERHIWRSVDSYPSAASHLSGKFESEGRVYSLVSYYDEKSLYSDVEHATADGIRYCGPGMVCRDVKGDRIYIRLQPPSEEVVGRQFNIPADTDPRANSLHISGSYYGLMFREGASHINVEGIEIVGPRIAIRVFSGTDFTFRDLTLTPGSNGMVVEREIERITVDGCTINCHFPPWIAWTDLKGSGGVPAKSLKLGGIVFTGHCSEIEIGNCHFVGVFDGVTVAHLMEDLRVHHNRFDVVDDAMQLGTSSVDVEFAYNLCIGPGPSHHGTGTPARPGTTWIHHNVIDCSEPMLWGRTDPDEVLKSKYRGWRHHCPIPTHRGGGWGEGDPWKVYQNTFIFGDHPANRGAGFTNRGPRDTGVPNEAFNNVCVQVSDDFALRGWTIGDGMERYDGNVYWRAVEDPQERRFFHQMVGPDGQSHDFASLAAFLASPLFELTREHYPPGWESSGIQADPLLGEDYRPAADGPAASGAVDLSETGWPGASDEGHRGALPPVGGCVGPLP